MKTILFICCFASIALGQGVTDTSSPSLGQVARENRGSKPASSRKVYTNEDLPQSGGISVVGTNTNQPAAETPSGAEPAANERDWHRVLAAQKARIAQLEQQLAVAEENQRLSMHRYTIGANPRYERLTKQVESLKEQVEEAKQQLVELQDEAHKAGANKAYD